MTIYFCTNSILPLECITTFGVSAKETDNPIGYFGTGLKYALAVLMREGCTVSIAICDDDNTKYYYTISTEKRAIRNKSFDIVYMNDLALPFTIDLGRNWELWQAYRELYSNTIDEDGEIIKTDSPFVPYGTIIKVDGLDKIHDDRCEFLLDTEVKYQLNDTVEVHEPEDKDNTAIFYHGIKVLDTKARYNYNFTGHMSLTEDRTVSQWDTEYEISRAIVKSKDIDHLTAMLTIDKNKDYFESKIRYQDYISPSVEFMKLASELELASSAKDYFYSHRAKYIPKIGQHYLSAPVKNKIKNLKALLPFKPKEIYFSELKNKDYEVIENDIVLATHLITKPKKLKFAYLLACYKMKKHSDKNDYYIIREEVLKHYTLKLK